jgi:aspartate racemase
MVDMPRKVIGVLGGMGPESTAELLRRITRVTPVETEQDHLRVLIDSNPQIPNRTDALLSGKRGAVVDALIATAKNLQRAGAQLLGIPCNTAHAFLGDVVTAIPIPIVDMIRETALAVGVRFGSGSKVGLLATDGTIRTRLHHDALAAVDVGCTSPPTPDVQDRLMLALDDVKRRGVTVDAAAAIAAAVADITKASRVTALIAGCTEVSLVLDCHPPAMPWMDPLQILAEALVREAMRDGDS